MAPTLSTARGLCNVVPHSEKESSSLTLCGIKFMDSHTDNASYPMLAHVPRVLSNPNTHTHRHCEIPYVIWTQCAGITKSIFSVFEKFDTIGDHIEGRKANQLFFLNTFESKQVPKS